MIDQLKPGQKIRCTIKRVPNAKGPRDTIARLMRQDPDNARALRAGQQRRKKTNNPYIRGNRLWVARVKAAKVVRVVEDRSWEMAYIPVLEPDLRSVEKYLELEAG